MSKIPPLVYIVVSFILFGAGISSFYEQDKERRRLVLESSAHDPYNLLIASYSMMLIYTSIYTSIYTENYPDIFNPKNYAKIVGTKVVNTKNSRKSLYELIFGNGPMVFIMYLVLLISAGLLISIVVHRDNKDELENEEEKNTITTFSVICLLILFFSVFV